MRWWRICVWICSCRRARALTHRAGQFVQIERFGDEVGGPQSHRADQVVYRGHSGHQDEGGIGDAFRLTEQVDGGSIRQPQIGHDQVVRFTPLQTTGLVTCARDAYVHPEGLAQVRGQQAGQIAVVLEDEQPCPARAPHAHGWLLCEMRRACLCHGWSLPWRPQVRSAILVMSRSMPSGLRTDPSAPTAASVRIGTGRTTPLTNIA